MDVQGTSKKQYRAEKLPLHHSGNIILIFGQKRCCHFKQMSLSLPFMQSSELLLVNSCYLSVIPAKSISMPKHTVLGSILSLVYCFLFICFKGCFAYAFKLLKHKVAFPYRNTNLCFLPELIHLNPVSSTTKSTPLALVLINETQIFCLFCHF